MAKKKKTVSPRLFVLSVAAGMILFLGGLYIGRQLDSPPAAVDLVGQRQQLINRVAPAVVTIQNEHNGPVSAIWPHAAYSRSGAGYIAASDGLIVTNIQNVPEPSLDYFVELADGKSYPATILFRDEVYGLVLLQIDVLNLPVLELAQVEARPGDTVYSFGNRLDGGVPLVDAGQITGVHRQAEFHADQKKVAPSDDTDTDAVVGSTAGDTGWEKVLLTYRDVLLADTQGGYGYTGGPLVNETGQVVGLNFALDEGQPGGFAVSLDTLRYVLDSFVRHGVVPLADMGIRKYMIGSRLEADGQFPYGASLNTFATGAPAVLAGLAPHDRIMTIDDQRVSMAMPLEKILRRYQPGDQVTVQYISPLGYHKQTQVTLVNRDSLGSTEAVVSCIP